MKHHYILMRQGNTMSLQCDGQTIQQMQMDRNPESIEISSGTPAPLIDEIVFYDHKNDFEPQYDHMNLRYLIDGVDLKDYDVRVSASTGLVGSLRTKEMPTISYNDRNGDFVCLDNAFYQKRDITLACFIQAQNPYEFVCKVDDFTGLFCGAGLRQLVVQLYESLPLVYMVYLSEEVKISKKWKNGLMCGTFSLQLNEPEPVKKVLKTFSESCHVEITAPENEYYTVAWGDSTVDYDVRGAFTHSYKEEGEHLVCVMGNIDKITEFSTDAIILWDKI